MLVSQFSFDLPKERIAQTPAEPRDSARLLDVSQPGLVDRIMSDLPKLLRKGDLLILNNTKVIPARLFGSCGAAKAEVTLHKRLSESSWKAFAKPARKFKPGQHFVVDEQFSARITDKQEGEVTLEFSASGADLFAHLERCGVPPLPPYISRKEGKRARDVEQYQTIFAKTQGAVAAPTAGLHFTPELLAAIEPLGVAKAFVTLHVGAGTFLPVKVADTKDHVMHSEWCQLSPEVAQLINRTKEQGGRVIAVGTTSLRVLESAAPVQGRVEAFEGETDIFITPGYDFKIVDALLTNFHLPESTLFMLVCAFAGLDRMQEAYAHAIAAGYRFYSYGDGCFLVR